VLLANHDFHSWRTIVLEPKGFAVAMDKILVPHKGYNEVFEVGNQIKLKVSDFVGNHRDNDEKESQHLIVDRKEITNLEEYENQLGFQLSDLNGNSGHKYFEISLNPPLKFPNFSMTFPHSLKNVEVKNLKSVVELATKAMYCTNINAIKAECYYILGKVYHLHKNLNNAFDFYGKALQLLPDMAPAAFGAAQIYFIKQDYPNALKLFTDLLQGNQDDKDTLAYVKLLKSILNEEITPFEKLREITPGFQYEIDLWLIQGQLRHKKVSSSLNVAELTESLKCYIYAKECYENQGMKLPLNILNNISNLYYLIGNHDKALDYLKLLFEQYHEENVNAPVTPLPEGIDFTSLYNHADFENVYYTWNLKKPVTTVVQDPNDSNKFLLSQQDSNQNDNFTINLQELLQIGDEIMIENMIWIVESIPSPSEFTAKTVYNSTYVYSTNLNKLREMKQMFAKEKEKDKSFKAPSLSEMIEILSNEPNPLSIYIKEKWNNFNDQTLTYTYNLARILEDGGQIQSSRTLYQLIVAVHPSHADCKQLFLPSFFHNFNFFLFFQ
jgi:tetratricopeptide (TPR) repeat protein